MSDLKRREMLKLLGSAPGAAALIPWTGEDAVQAAQQSQAARAQAAAQGRVYRPKFFTAREYATVVALSAMIIPKDDRSVSAADAGAPEFIDHIVSLQIDRQTPMRGGLAWLDTECRRRFDKSFLQAVDAQRREVLDDIAWPRRARPEMAHGVRFFTSMRDLVAAGFFSSKVGVADLGYMGNRVVAEWTGAPEEILRKLGVRYD